jgi:hypothetical protein
MARARNIKPAFFDNEDLAELPGLNRLLFIGLWCLADREGRIELRPKRIKAQLFPYDDCNVGEMLNALSSYKFINIYNVDGKDYLQINKWAKHQNPHHKEVASILPAPENHKDTVCFGYIPMSNTIRNRTYDRCGRVCVCCGALDNLEVDHKMPVSKGGNSVDDNLQILCKRCNVKKFNNYIDFSRLPIDKLSMVQAWFKHGSSITQEQFNEIASCHTDSLIPITDSLSLNPDSEHQEPLFDSIESTTDIISELPVSRFNEFWDLYGKKTGRPKCEAKFKKLKPAEIEKIFAALPAYIQSTPDKQFRKNPETWINNKAWDDEITQIGRSVTTKPKTSLHNLQGIDYGQSGSF